MKWYCIVALYLNVFIVVVTVVISYWSFLLLLLVELVSYSTIILKKINQYNRRVEMDDMNVHKLFAIKYF